MPDPYPCPLCSEPTRSSTIPVRVERRGREILELLVPTRVCTRCEHVAVEDETIQEVVATLELHTEPGDDVVLPAGATLH